MINFSPFFINSNIVTNESSLCDYDSFMNAVAGNTGNSYITWALLKELGVKELKDEFHIQNIYDFDFVKNEKVSDFVNQNCTHVFLVLQDQIRIHESYSYKLPYEGIKNLLEKIKLPVIVAGLGANSFTGFDPDFHNQLPKDLVEFLNYLSKRCKELGVRGNFTAEVLNQLGIKNVSPIGCPSFYEMGPERIIRKKDSLSANKIFFTSTFNNILNEKNYMVCQDHLEREIIKLIAYGELGEAYKIEIMIQKYARKRYKIFSSISEWKDFASCFDFAVGYRVHGSILSLNSGCIPLCCNGDSRAKEMCELMKIPHNGAFAPDSNLFDAYEKIDVSKINEAYPKLYENFASFINRNCGVDITSNLLPMTNNTSPSLKLYKDYNEVISESSLKMQFEIKRDTERKISELETKYSSMYATIEEQKATIDNLHAVATDCRLQINSIYASSSWKITKPLRLVGRIAKKILR